MAIFIYSEKLDNSISIPTNSDKIFVIIDSLFKLSFDNNYSSLEVEDIALSGDSLIKLQGHLQAYIIERINLRPNIADVNTVKLFLQIEIKLNLYNAEDWILSVLIGLFEMISKAIESQTFIYFYNISDLRDGICDRLFSVIKVNKMITIQEAYNKIQSIMLQARGREVQIRPLEEFKGGASKLIQRGFIEKVDFEDQEMFKPTLKGERISL